MWLLLREDISKVFKSNDEYTYLFPINKNNFFIGKNNSGKSYFSRFLMKNSIRLYRSPRELIKDISDNLKNIPRNIEEFKDLKNNSVNSVVAEFLNYEQLLEKINNSKRENGMSTIFGLTTTSVENYNYINSETLFEEIKPLVNFLNLNYKGKGMEKTLNWDVIPKLNEIKKQIKEKFIQSLLHKLNTIADDKIYELGDLLIKIEFLKNRENQNKKIYIPVMRSIRHPEKETDKKEFMDDIYKKRSISEYNLNEKEIQVVTGLDFYKNYKNALLGSKEKRKGVNEFEKFLSQYFFDGEDISIIPDEETFELKININDSKEDRFIYQVGDGISSLLIIAYTIFTEANEENKLFFIEEPETSFHPGFQRLLINIITYYKKFENCIFFFSTHSNHLIDIGVNEMKNSNLILCKKDQSDEISINIQGESYNEILEELGVQASSVRIANKIIWVEGKYDALYIRLLLNMKNKDEDGKKYIEDYDYCFVPYGGANMSLIKFDLEQDNEENKNFILKAEKINNKFIIILDDDNMKDEPDSEKFKRYNKLKEKMNEKIYKLEVREIENLFPEEVVKEYVLQGLIDKSKVDKMTFSYNEYKDKKLGNYINQKIQEAYGAESLKTITGRENGFEKNGFLYNKQKYYEEVLKWTNKENFNYEQDVPTEAKELINVIENFIKTN